MLPGGIQELLLILGALYLFNAEVVVFDEPGKSLHPQWRIRLAEIFRQSRCQIILTTHAVEFVPRGDNKNVVHCHIDPPHGTVVRVISDQLFEASQKKIENLKERNQFYHHSFLMESFATPILFAERVLFVEGPADLVVIEALLVGIGPW